MICPECTQPMHEIPSTKTLAFTACIRFEKWRCDPCKLTARVETIFEPDPPLGASDNGI